VTQWRRQQSTQTVSQGALGPTTIIENPWLKLEAELDKLMIKERIPSFHSKGHEIAVIPFEQLRKKQLPDLAEPLRLLIEFQISVNF